MAIMPLRKFAEPACSIASAWFETPFYTGGLTITGNYSATAEGACAIDLASGDRAFMKPRPEANKKDLVAREKIAADLGHLLNLPVAPVVVRPPADANSFYSSVSLVCLPGGRTWVGDQAHVNSSAEQLEALRVFWSWIGDNDHHAGNPGNLIFEMTEDGCSVVSIDHGHALGRHNPQDPLAVGVSAGYGSAGLGHAIGARDQTMAAVRELDADEIERVVRRLDVLLTSEEQERILAFLSARRERLAKMLGL